MRAGTYFFHLGQVKHHWRNSFVFWEVVVPCIPIPHEFTLPYQRQPFTWVSRLAPGRALLLEAGISQEGVPIRSAQGFSVFLDSELL